MTPDQYTNQELFVEVGNGHELYVHDWGNKDAKNIIFFLHGGPGSGCSDRHKGQFDPTRQRVVFHDQRGSGRSLPAGSLDHNTTAKLITDISKIADKLGVKKFTLTGSSWGSTLALAYALDYPERVKAIVIDGIFTGTEAEIDWLDKGRFETFYPDAWQTYLQQTPKAHRHNPTIYHFKQVLEGAQTAAKQSGYTYSMLEYAVLSLDDRFSPEPFDEFDISSIRLEIHYLANKCFLPERHILDHAHKLTMPVYLIQGRYDMVCPPITAYQLHHQLPNSELIFTISGHHGEREAWNLKRMLLLELGK